VGFANGSVQVWDTITGTIGLDFCCCSDLVRRLAFSSDGQVIASSSANSEIRLWDTRTGTLGQTLHSHHESVLTLAFVPESPVIASGSSDNAIRLGIQLAITTVIAPDLMVYKL
jgi:WD40 repeat protein